MKRTLILILALSLAFTTSAQKKYALHDEQGRQIIPRGFVINTEDGVGDIFYTEDDYHRMVRMGANFQVVRLRLGKLGGYPGNELDESYLLHLDTLVRFGKNAGMKTDFKMTVYGSTGFSWGDFWRNEHGELDQLAEAWKILWERYKDEPSVFGYDLLNEPMKGDIEYSYEETADKLLVPLYVKLIDMAREISPHKKLLYQPLCIPICSDWDVYVPPFIRMKVPIHRENIVFAPHIYEGDKSRIPIWMKQYKQDAALSDAPLFIGEWGAASFDRVDSSITWQHRFIDFYMETVSIFDNMGVGSVKPWFTGTTFKGAKPDWEGWDKDWWQASYTWSIFSDERQVGTVERKYITDILARPYPQVIAGEIESYQYDFATRSMDVFLKTDNSKGASRIFVGADRHYPDGFTIICNEDFIMYVNPLNTTGIEVYKSGWSSNPSDFIWDDSRQQLVILKWPVDGENLNLRIVPGIGNMP